MKFDEHDQLFGSSTCGTHTRVARFWSRGIEDPASPVSDITLISCIDFLEKLHVTYLDYLHIFILAMRQLLETAEPPLTMEWLHRWFRERPKIFNRNLFLFFSASYVLHVNISL